MHYSLESHRASHCLPLYDRGLTRPTTFDRGDRICRRTSAACRCTTGGCPAEAGNTSHLLPLLGATGLETTQNTQQHTYTPEIPTGVGRALPAAVRQGAVPLELETPAVCYLC